MDADSAPIVADICRRLDGIPLAIELAASRANVLSATELGERLADRFRLLTSRSRSAPARHQTLRAAIEWSHQALDEQEASLLRRLSVFAGGWMLEGAEALHEPGPDDPLVLDTLSRLVDKSLVVVEQRAGGATRYRMLETVREFGLERLGASGEEEATRDRHLAFMVRFAEEGGQHLRAAGQDRWLPLVDAEQENVITAIRWGTRHGAPSEPAIRIAAALWGAWWIRGSLEIGYDALDRARRHDDPPSRIPQRVELLRGLGAIALYYLTDKSVARRHFEESAALGEAIGDRAGLGRALQALANVLVGEGDLDAARDQSMRALELARENGGPRGVAAALNSLGEIERARGRFHEAVPHYRESADVALATEDFDGASQVLLNLTMCFVPAGRPRRRARSPVTRDRHHRAHRGATRCDGRVRHCGSRCPSRGRSRSCCRGGTELPMGFAIVSARHATPETLLHTSASKPTLHSVWEPTRTSGSRTAVHRRNSRIPCATFVHGCQGGPS